MCTEAETIYYVYPDVEFVNEKIFRQFHSKKPGFEFSVTEIVKEVTDYKGRNMFRVISVSSSTLSKKLWPCIEGVTILRDLTQGVMIDSHNNISISNKRAFTSSDSNDFDDTYNVKQDNSISGYISILFDLVDELSGKISRIEESNEEIIKKVKEIASGNVPQEMAKNVLEEMFKESL